MKKQTIIFILGFILIVAGALFYVGIYNTFKDRVSSANDLGKSWIFRNLRDQGLFVYSLDPMEGKFSGKNNAIRQLMASRVLAQESVKDARLEKGHRGNLDFIFKYWYRENGNISYVFFDNKSKLGANAMLLRTLVYSPFFDEYEDQAQKLAEGILTLQDKETGAFKAWYIAPSYEYNEDYLLTFYSGEALLALIEYYEKTNDIKWLDAAKLSADFYIDRYVTHLDENYYPAYVPWHTISFNKLYKIVGEQKYADAIFIMNDKLLELQDTTGLVGRFYNPEYPQYGSPHASSDGVYTEGLAYAYEIAKIVGDKNHTRTYKEAIKIAFNNLEWLQYKEEVPQFDIDPARYVGALRTKADSLDIRVDTTQHAVDAFSKILEVF